jgi:hypothetical protein
MRIPLPKSNLIKAVYLSIFLIQGIVAVAQKVSQPADIEHPKKIASPKDHIVLDLNFDSYRNLPPGITQKPYSIGGNVFLVWDYPIGYGPFSISFGAGFSTHDLQSNGRVIYSIDGKYTSLVPITTPYTTNKLSCNYVEVPMEIRIRTRGMNSFKMAVGGKVGYAFNVHTKFADADGKIKVYDIKNIDPLRYGVTLRIGYNKFDVQAFYALSELFVSGRGEPGMVPYSIGIGLLLY